MVVSATFKVGDLSPYMEDALEDPSNLRSNSLEEGQIDVGACSMESQDVNNA